VSLDLSSLSRVVSHALRHEPWLFELELDGAGWVGVDELIAAVRGSGPEWSALDSGLLERMVVESPKQRHEIVGDRIRALYGHSLPGLLRREVGVPPDRLFHGTTRSAAELIAESGLLPMGRQFVHLSVDRDTAVQVGRRKGGVLVVLSVRAGDAHSAGVSFFVGNASVWLALAVPPEFVIFANR
jgi:putative RNA 2'-phosphotransferase